MAACLLLGYWAGAVLFGSHPNLSRTILVVQLAALFAPFPVNVLARFHRPDATEWLMGLGNSRKLLAFYYAADLLGWSLLHAAGGTVLYAASGYAPFGGFDWPPHKSVGLAFLSLFFLQVSLRSAWAVVMHLETSTLVPARMRDALNGTPTSRLARVGWSAAAILLLLALLAAPVGLCAAAGSVLWLGVSAAVYLRIVHALAVTSEFVLRPDSASIVFSGMPAADPARAPSRDRYGEGGPEGASRAVLRGLCWEGLNPWAKRTPWLYPLFAAFVGVLTLFHSPSEEIEAFWFLVIFLAGVPLGILFFLHKKLFVWTANEDAVEYLYVRGVTFRTMARVRLVAAGLLAAALLVCFVFLWPARLQSPVLIGIVLTACAVLLLEGNPKPLRRPLWKLERVEHFGSLLRFFWVFYLLALVYWKPLAGYGWTFWGTLGIIFLPAAAAWAQSLAAALPRK